MKKLLGYITGAFPSVSFSQDLILAMAENGADKIELGIPFSDPVADGEVIARANLESLKQGFAFRDILEIAQKTSHAVDVLVMGYANPFYRIGLDRSFACLHESGIKGVIIPDVPCEESLPYKTLAKKHHLSFVSFVAPTTPLGRIPLLVQDSEDFIYLVAYAGITGDSKNENLDLIIDHIRKHSQTPLYLGFGIDQTNAWQKSRHVDGVIVGSAFVRILLQDLTYQEKIARISSLTREIKEAING